MSKEEVMPQQVAFVPSGWPFVVLFGFVKAKVRPVIQEKDMTKTTSTRKTVVKPAAVAPIPYNEFRAASVVLGYKTRTGSRAIDKLVGTYQTSGIPANVREAVVSWAKAGDKKVWGLNTEPKTGRKVTPARTSTRTATKAKAKAAVSASGFTEAQLAEIAQVIKAVLSAS